MNDWHANKNAYDNARAKMSQRERESFDAFIIGALFVTCNVDAFNNAVETATKCVDDIRRNDK